MALHPVPLIAIVDDDDRVRRSLGNLLRSFQLRTRIFSSSEAFLASDMRDLACLILDLRMPRMNGLELQRRIRAHAVRLPIIFVTSYADEDSRRRALAAGAVAFLLKPVRAEQLLNAIGAALTSTAGPAPKS